MKGRLKHEKPEDDEQVLLRSAVTALETVSKRACYHQQNENSIDKLVANYVAAEIATLQDQFDEERLKRKIQGLTFEVKIVLLKKKKQT